MVETIKSVIESKLNTEYRQEVERLDIPRPKGPCTDSDCPDGWDRLSFHVYDTVSYYDSLKCPLNILYCCDSVVVNYFLDVCLSPDRTNIVFYITHFAAYPLCDTVWAYWNKLDRENLLDSLYREIERFDYDLGVLVEDDIAQSLLTAAGDVFRCSNGLNFVQSHFITLSCYKWCLIIDYTKSPPYEGKKVQCGYKCCKRTKEYCLDSEDHLVIKSTTFSEVNSCDDRTNPTDCSGLWLGPCEKECGERP